MQLDYRCSVKLCPVGGAQRLQPKGDRRKYRRSQLITSSLSPCTWFSYLPWWNKKWRYDIGGTYPFHYRSPHPAKDRSRKIYCSNSDSSQMYLCIYRKQTRITIRFLACVWRCKDRSPRKSVSGICLCHQRHFKTDNKNLNLNHNLTLVQL